MTMTRANVEALLIRRCGTALTQAGLDGTTQDGSNGELNDPIGRALRILEYTTATPADITDSDLAALEDDDIDALLDLAELRTLETVYNVVVDKVDTTVGPQRQNLAQWANALDAKIQRLQEQARALYGLGAPKLEGGVLDLDFMEKTTL
jgi:hypothetical protein